jgi:hypothetical protein
MKRETYRAGLQGVTAVSRFNEPIVGESRAAGDWWPSWTEEGRALTMAGIWCDQMW